MALLSKWIELIITQDTGHFVKVTALLNANGIAYREKTQNIGHKNRRYGPIGALGENASCATLYQVYVKKDDLAHAKKLVAHYSQSS